MINRKLILLSVISLVLIGCSGNQHVYDPKKDENTEYILLDSINSKLFYKYKNETLSTGAFFDVELLIYNEHHPELSILSMVKKDEYPKVYGFSIGLSNENNMPLNVVDLDIVNHPNIVSGYGNFRYTSYSFQELKYQNSTENKPSEFNITVYFDNDEEKHNVKLKDPYITVSQEYINELMSDDYQKTSTGKNRDAKTIICAYYLTIMDFDFHKWLNEYEKLLSYYEKLKGSEKNEFKGYYKYLRSIYFSNGYTYPDLFGDSKNKLEELLREEERLGINE